MEKIELHADPGARTDTLSHPARENASGESTSAEAMQPALAVSRELLHKRKV